MFEQTEAQLQALVTQHVVPGISYAILSKRQVEQKVLGLAQLQPQPEILKPGMLYDLASLTKVVGTTTLLLQLLEHNQLSIETRVHRILPEFKDKRVTILDLMTHTSGLTGYIENRETLDAADLKRALLTQLTVGPNFRKKVVYTDIGLLYVGWMIEAILDRPVQDLIQQAVLTPLGMTRSTFAPQPEQSVPTEVFGKNVLRGIVHDPKSRVLKNHSAAAGLFAPLSDLIRFAQFQLGQLTVEHPPVTQASVQSLYHDWTAQHLGRSIGWDLRFDPKHNYPLLYHTGYTGTFMLLDKRKQTGLIVLTNRVHPTADNPLFLTKRDEIIQTFLTENSQHQKRSVIQPFSAEH